ncbi:hypothetical protein RirG_105460 [Rhizophagus irregularis DAOM 197198w]|uniref:TLDc domain-containing protein n=1 Tax=Rhizophagus irregularis (strain DAOM 197198w) TaxID=1432141 RepID=A0A015L757_RHIIW|nr:hypothetical protein RirG_105460 [Rhizophagus irregularis DAOM 197198w]
MDKVLPYKKILPKELYKDLLKSFLSLLKPNSKLSNNLNPHLTNLKAIDSKIITSQHNELISKWIDRLKISDKLASPYEFGLLLRGSRDGFARDKFHEISDGIPRTVTIVKVQGSNEILGGYNPNKWESDFVIEDHILSRVMNENFAIKNGSICGPSFGNGDLIIWELGYCRCKKRSYEKPIRKLKIILL